MSLLMQFKFQAVTKYVCPYGMALYYYIVIPQSTLIERQVHSRYELNARRDIRVLFASNVCQVHDS